MIWLMFYHQVRAGDADSQKLTLSPMEDPEGWYQRVSDDWAVADKLVLCRKQLDGSSVACNWLVFEQGDFVDIAATFDVCNRGQQGIHVNLCIYQVVQLIAKEMNVSTNEILRRI